MSTTSYPHKAERPQIGASAVYIYFGEYRSIVGFSFQGSLITQEVSQLHLYISMFSTESKESSVPNVGSCSLFIFRLLASSGIGIANAYAIYGH